MLSDVQFRHLFVDAIPRDLEEGTLYISIPFATAVHRCACGCGSEVVTPLSPTDWRVTFDGKTVSLSPSIGNWGFACRSHYWIENDRACWAEKWSRDEIEAGRQKDRAAKEDYFGRTDSLEERGKIRRAEPKPSFWKRARAIIWGKRRK